MKTIDVRTKVESDTVHLPELTSLVVKPVAVCIVELPTVAEMFVGVRTPTQEARCLATLATFQRLAIPDVLWETVGRNQARLRANGVTVQLADTVLATLAIAQGMELWTYDVHFTLIQTV